MTTAGLSIELGHQPRLCYAMQQSAVPWLSTLRLVHAGAEALTDLRVTIELRPDFAAPRTVHVAAVPAGGVLELPAPDLVLDGRVLANTLERTRADLVVRALRGDEVLATTQSTVDVLAYNEWPGLPVMPALLAAFVSPNHPGIAGLAGEVAAELQQRTGRSALDGYQGGDTGRVRTMLAAAFDVLARRGIVYVTPPPSFEQQGQKVRTPEQVLGERLGTCLDLALLWAALLEHIGLLPLVVIEQGHAFAGAWLRPASTPEAEVGSAVELRKRCDLGVLAFVECTALCASGAQRFEAAVADARRRLGAEANFRLAIDIGAARRIGVHPLPPRTGSYAPVAPTNVLSADESLPVAPLPAAAPTSAAEAAEPVPEAPKDRLEHWKSKLIDLTLWNRLLNTVATKKTIPLCAPALAALEDRLQGGGRFRVHARPALGAAGKDPRDLDLAAQRTGEDVRASYLAEELRAGRLRADLEPDELDARLVEIFRHARTSLEESGANTLYLALGFLHWYESPTSEKVRRAPLLLLPLTMERLSVQEGFRLVLDDGEPRVNQSLIAMLARDHDLHVALGETPPEDEHGVDVGAVLEAFRAATLSVPRWEVHDEAWIGFFSFTKYLMWLDLAARDELLRSPVLRHLIERPGATFAQEVPEVPRDELDDLDPAAVFCPKDADSSQLAAVLAGAEGRTFVLEGPPGTGKSQTITNLIAQALAHGKRVLFVAEKRAALEVVQRRLDEVGIGPFCLELHSSKSGPKAVLAQLRRALDQGARQAPQQWAQVGADLQQQREQLNEFVRALHRRRERGGSVFEAMTQLIALGAARRIELPALRTATPAAAAAAGEAVDRLAAAASVLGVPDQEPWWGVQLGDWTPALLREVVPLAERLAAAADAMAAAVRTIAPSFGLEPAFGFDGPSADQLDLLLRLCERCTAPSLPPSALLLADWREAAPRLAEALAAGARRERAWAQLADRWSPGLLDLDVDRLLAIHRDAAGSFFLLRWWRLRGPRAELRQVATHGRVGGAAAVVADLEFAVQVRREDRALAAQAQVAQLLGAHWRDGRPDWNVVTAWVDWVEHVRSLLVQLRPGTLQPDPAALAATAAQLDGLLAGAAVLPPQIAALRSADDELGAVRRAAVQVLQLDEVAAFGPAARPGRLPGIAARARGWLAAVPRLRDHCAYRRAAAAADAAGAAQLVAAHATGELPTSSLVPSFRRTSLEDWLDRVHVAEPLLARFRGADHERAIAEFAALDRRAIRLAAEVILARLCAHLPQVRDTQVQSSELGTLERELKKQRRHKPVRRLLAEIPDLFARLAPCVLMSPLSVAQFLGRAGTRFDLVVFDEASQIPMWDAVGAIGRGDSLVVVGDSRQLPPTTFFQRLAQGDEPQPDDLPEDLESVLDECGAAGLPKLHLDWHYRSRHESLITFSNHHYYGNRLLTFPAPQPAADGLGVRCVLVDGVYDRAGSQTNRVEAERLVADVVARLRDPERAQHSVGIVTFSRAQQVLIEDLLDRERALHPELEAAFADAAEPLFVKNLENVQGDERDAIYFSICYGADAAGKVYENYGPLNTQGGERRLNVAVTRARRELIVFTSVRPEQVANRTAALGARHLRTFLDYALRGQVALTAAVAADPSGDVESPFEAAVRDALVQRGHEVHTQIGCSGYRIDLAVVDPEAPGRYLLGIECDGAAYHSAATARDRDRLRAAVLQGLGWRLHRVWSTDFWQDAAGELDRIEVELAAAAAAVRAAPAATVVAVPEPAVAAEPLPKPAGDVVPVEDPDGPRPYATAALDRGGGPDDFAAPAATSRLREQMLGLLAVEAPIAFATVARRIAEAWGVSRVTERVRDRLRDALPDQVAVVDDVLWFGAVDAASFRGFRVPADGDAPARAADDLVLVEVTNAMQWLLRQHAALAEDDLAREAARCFGIQRLGSVVRDVMARALEHLLASGRGRRDGELVRLP